MNASGVGSGTTSSSSDTGSDRPAMPEGLSAFIARVLDQLSISSWLPAALSVAGLYFAFRFRIADGDAKQALIAVGGTEIEQLVVLLGAVVILTTVTQAFEFGSIRLLEGYWGTGRLSLALADILARRFEVRHRDASGHRESLLLQAFRTAEAGFARAVGDVDIVRHVHADLLDLDDPPQLSQDQEKILDEVDWRQYAAAGTMRRLEMHEVRFKRLPSASQIMPTKLGNLLRASEERANEQIPGSVQGMIHRTYHLLPGHLKLETDQFRNRLGLYASLVVTECFVTVASFSLVLPAGIVPAVTIGVPHVLLIALFYRATLGSAEAYGEMLETVADFVGKNNADSSSSEASKPGS